MTGKDGLEKLLAIGRKAKLDSAYGDYFERLKQRLQGRAAQPDESPPLQC